MDDSQLDAVMSGKIDIGSAFGLPNKTSTSTYHLFETAVDQAQVK